MGIFLSCPFSDDSDLESQLESVIVKSVSFGRNDEKTPLRSISFNRRLSDTEPTIARSLGSGEMLMEGSISFKRRESGALISIEHPVVPLSEYKDLSVASSVPNAKEVDDQSQISSGSMYIKQELPPAISHNPKHEAAVKLQKVYKSFRTRRKLADCAVLVEQSWWKLLDFAELKRSSISFFDLEKNETAISRWSRARTRVAKVGKGLLKNDRAQKLALQHWLEAIDPRHRYGHNLHFYYVKWLDCQSREPFFYWLDIGEGKEVNLEKCPRSKLQQQFIKYLGPIERKAYEVTIENGKFLYKRTGDLLHTAGEPADAKWIFVLSTSKTLYVGKKKKGSFQHSSFLAGGATSAAGRLVVEHGSLKAVWPHSGHYRPTEENFNDFISFLKENNVDISNVKLSPEDEDENLSCWQRGSVHLRNHSSGEVLGLVIDGKDVQSSTFEKTDLTEEPVTATSNFSDDNISAELHSDNTLHGSAINGQEVTEAQNNAIQKPNLLHPEDEESEPVLTQVEEVVQVPSHRKPKSLQLGKQLSCKWTTGAGPRIGCVRNYPPELQFRALEEVNLSPRYVDPSRSLFLSPRSTCGLSPAASKLALSVEQR